MNKHVVSLLVLALVALTHNLHAQGTAFTYQGQLQNSGGPARGSFDFSFVLYDTNDPATARQIGGTLTETNVGVTNGLFTVMLDFGGVFAGNATWLAVGVRTSGGNAFTALSPWQELTPTPYAVYAGNAASVSGAISLAQLPAGVVTNGDATVNLTGTFSGDGSQLTNVTAATLSAFSGTTNYYTTNGNYTFTVPPWASQAVVKLWGAGGGNAVILSHGEEIGGGAGAFSETTLNVTPGQIYVLVVGQGGATGSGGGIASAYPNDACGGAGLYGNFSTDFGTAGNGGQASSIFQFTGAAYIMKAVAGGGAGGSDFGNGFNYSGQAGQAKGTGAGYATTATSSGVANLNLPGGNGASGVTYITGGGGGGYGGGAAGNFSASGGGGSYGNVTMGGTNDVPGNNSDLDYLPPAATAEEDGLGVVIFTPVNPGVNLAATIQAPGLVIEGTSPIAAIAPLTIPPTAPANALGSIGTQVGPQSVAVAGRYVYVVGGNNLLQVFDVSTPAAPAKIGSVTTGNGSSSVAVAGRYAYVVNSTSDSLQVLDVSAPAAPVVIGSTNTGALPTSVAVAGRYAYVVNSGSSTLQVFDVNAPTAPVSVGSTNTGATPYAVAISGRYAYVTSQGGGLQVFDVGNPAAPVVVGSAGTGLYPLFVAVAGRYAYVVNNGSGTLQVFDVSTNSAPAGVGSVNTGATPTSVAVAGRYAFVTSQAGLQVFDVSTPASPVSIGAAAAGASPNCVAVAGRYAYVVNFSFSSSTLQTFDLGGAYLQNLEAGAVEAGTLQTRDTVTVGKNLDVRGGFTASGSARISGSLGVTGGLTINNPGNMPALTISDTNDNTSWSEYIDTLGSVDSLIFRASNGQYLGINLANGTAFSSSDERLKKDITGLGHVLDRVMQLQPVSYHFTNNTAADPLTYGLLAQEVAPLFPEVVQHHEGLLGLSYTELVPVTVKAIQELNLKFAAKDAEIEQLRTKADEVDELKKQNDALNARLDELEATVRTLAEKK